MQFSLKFSALLVALVGVHVNAAPQPEPASFIVSHEEMSHWLANTDAELTYVGEPINPLSGRAAQNTMVTYCNRRINNICGGTCTVYNGGATCLATPGVKCLAATHNVGFCDRGGCGHSCNQLSSCGTRLENNFCYTPGTESILVSSA